MLFKISAHWILFLIDSCLTNELNWKFKVVAITYTIEMLFYWYWSIEIILALYYFSFSFGTIIAMMNTAIDVLKNGKALLNPILYGFRFLFYYRKICLIKRLSAKLHRDVLYGWNYLNGTAIPDCDDGLLPQEPHVTPEYYMEFMFLFYFIKICLVVWWTYLSFYYFGF